MPGSFADLSPRAQRIAAVIGVLQGALLVAAQTDIARRSDAELNGSRRAWQLACLVNVVGPLSYFRWGRAER